MLIKEYRIPLPLSVEQYRIAQLYMIQKKSREESQGTESGVEIIENEPYSDGPGGSGQHTQKIYHISKHIPGWLVSVLPKNALIVEEEAWNAYPYTRTRYTCPFIEKFSIDIETRYYNDAGQQDNVFNLSSSELRSRVVDEIDIVKEQTSDDKKDEDPRFYKSKKTGRGPLKDDWLVKVTNTSADEREPIMCAYKICKVEFKYWGMQSKIEKFIHDVGLRRVMLRAHKQAWCWQDEWVDLTMNDIRRLERETQLALQLKFGGSVPADDLEDSEVNLKESGDIAANGDRNGSTEVDGISRASSGSSIYRKQGGRSRRFNSAMFRRTSTCSMFSARSKLSLNNKEVYLDPALEGIRRYSTDVSSDDDEFYDATDEMPSVLNPLQSLSKWGGSNDDLTVNSGEQTYPQTIVDSELDQQMAADPSQPSRIAVLFLVVHGGNPADATNYGMSSKQSDLQILQSTMEQVAASHYNSAVGRFAFRLVACPAVCSDAYHLLQSISTQGCEGHQQPGSIISLLAASSSRHSELVQSLASTCNSVYNSFLSCPEGKGFTGQVCFIGDASGSIITYDMLCKLHLQLPRKTSFGSRRDSSLSVHERTSSFGGQTSQAMTSSPLVIPRRSSQTNAVTSCDVTSRLEFDVTQFFVLGSSLAYVLAMRQLSSASDSVSPQQPACLQMYNMFYGVDPSSARIEPLIHCKFSRMPPVNVSNYHMFPLGDEQSLSVGDLLSTSHDAFTDVQMTSRRYSEWSISSGCHDNQTNMTLTQKSLVHDHSSSDDDVVFGNPNGLCGHTHSSVAESWWGEKRIDYALFYPEGLSDFPTESLPHLFHASFWESEDLVAFILRQIFHRDHMRVRLRDGSSDAEFVPSQPREKWIKKRTNVKLRNITSNHRSRDEVSPEGNPQVLSGKFMYGLLDMVTLNGEKVDVYIMTPPPASEWVHLGTEITNNHGKITFKIPDAKKLGLGIYPVKMVVRGDHTFADSYLAVLPPQTDCVIFSIDGSFTASVSIMGSDPKVRPGAVDIVRLWQELGYVIIYVTARPDMQKQRVVTWLAQHNFPHGLVWFSDGLTHDPLKQKTLLLQKLKSDNNLNFSAGYGSSKDISVYSQLGLSPEWIFVVGKATKKQSNQCTWLSDGYSCHLNDLVTKNPPKASFNAQALLMSGSFGLPGQMSFSKTRSLSGKKSKSVKSDLNVRKAVPS